MAAGSTGTLLLAALRLISELRQPQPTTRTDCIPDLEIPSPAVEHVTSPRRIVCYFQNSAIYRSGRGRMSPDEIDASRCTHLVYSFARLTDDDRIVPNDPHADVTLGGYRKAFALRQENAQLRVLVALGGYNAGVTIFSRLVASPERRARFASSLVGFFEQYAFDGIDLDWEYPALARRGGVPEDRANFAIWLQELRGALDVHSVQSGHEYELSIAASASSFDIDNAFDVPAFEPYIDFINILSYDFHTTNERRTGHHSQLTARPSESGSAATLNAQWAVEKYLQLGMPAEKIVMGVPIYGRAWRLAGSDTSIGAIAVGPASPGPYTVEGGFLGYLEICERTTSGAWQAGSESGLPIAYGDQQWVGYDDAAFVRRKAEYAVSLGLGGICLWEISYADRENHCGGGAYPLISEIQAVFGSAPTETTTTTTDDTSTISSDATSSTTSSTTTTTIAPSTTAATTTTRAAPAGTLVCHLAGFYADPRSADCSNFVRCVDFPSLGLFVYQFQCPGGLIFDSLANVCNWRSVTTCVHNSSAVTIA